MEEGIYDKMQGSWTDPVQSFLFSQRALMAKKVKNNVAPSTTEAVIHLSPKLLGHLSDIWNTLIYFFIVNLFIHYMTDMGISYTPKKYFF